MAEQIKDILPSIIFAVVMGLLVFFTGLLFPTGYLLKLIVQLGVGAFLIFGLGELTKLEPYIEIKAIVRTKLKKVYHAR